GLSLTYLKDKFGETLYRYCCEQAQPHLQQEMLLQRDHSFFISKKGLFISDGIMSDLLFIEEE
ncbi:MAG: coproporphyrinogen III oxidase, partial [Bacteroidaceae bacterium]